MLGRDVLGHPRFLNRVRPPASTSPRGDVQSEFNVTPRSTADRCAETQHLSETISATTLVD
jgi:hypothetical protein